MLHESGLQHGTSANHARRFGSLVALMLIMLAGFGLRVYAVRWGLPYVDHHDEPSAANTALGMIRRGDWNPRFFEKPSLYYYALRIVFDAHWRYGLATGLYSGIEQLPLGTYYYTTTPGFFVWGRMLTVVCGVATLAVVYAVGRRWWGTAVGLLAAALLAVLPFHVRQSQFVTVDVLTGLMSALALLAALHLLDDGRWRTYALAGVLAGLAASAKYNAIAVVLVIIMAHGMHWRWASVRQGGRLVWAALWSAVGFLVATPYTLLTPDAFVAGIMKQYTKYSTITSGDLVGNWPVTGYLNFFWNNGLLPLPCIAVLAGAAVVLVRRDRAGLALLGFAVPYLVFAVSQIEHFFRNLMPIFPVLMWLAALGIVATAQALRQRFAAIRPAAQLGGVALVVAMFGVVALQPLVRAVALDQLFAQPHSKVRAGEYVREHLARGAPMALALNPVAWPNDPMATLTENVAEHDAAWYRSQGYRYLVGNLRNDHRDYEALRAETHVLAEFPGELDERPAPHMEALDLGFHPEQLAITRSEAVFDGRLRLLGFQQGAGNLRSAFAPLDSTPAVQAGQALQLNMYWEPLAPVPQDFSIFLHLVDSQGQTVAQRDTVMRAADYPSSHWQQSQLVVDLADLPIPTDVLTGTYQLQIGLYNAQTMARLPLADDADAALVLTNVAVQGAK